MTMFSMQEDDHFNLEKENTIRKRILREFNKTEEDFETLKEYNDYLEEVEDIIYNLVNNINVEETNRRITDYKIRNREQIAARKAQQAQEERQRRAMLAEQMMKKQQVDQQMDTEEGMPMEGISEVKVEQQQQGYVPTFGGADAPVHRQPAPKTLPSTVLTEQQKVDEETLRKRALAGGFLDEIVMKRAFDEAFGSLQALIAK